MPSILVMRLRGLGDIMHVLPCLAMLRNKYPNAVIGFLVQKPFGQVVPKSLNLKVFEIPRRPNLRQLLTTIKQVRKYKFDVIYDLFGNPATATISLCSGVKKRFGFNYRIRKWACTKTYQPPNANIELVKLFFDFFEYFGVKGEAPKFELAYSNEVKQKAQNAIPAQLLSLPFLLCVNPNSKIWLKAWPLEYYIELIKLWYKRFKLPVLVSYGPGEEQNAQRVINEAGADKAFTHKPLKISEFAECLRRVDLFVTADVGPMHIAWATNTPICALFGSSIREPVYPRGEEHLVLYNKELSCLECQNGAACQQRKDCMYSLKPSFVFNEICKKYSEKLDKLARN